MDINKTDIFNKICYTELVYDRINKKLQTNHSRAEIETLISKLIKDTPENQIQKTGKNFYIYNTDKNIRITINSYTYRIITVDRILKPQQKP